MIYNKINLKKMKHIKLENNPYLQQEKMKLYYTQAKYFLNFLMNLSQDFSGFIIVGFENP